MKKDREIKFILVILKGLFLEEILVVKKYNFDMYKVNVMLRFWELK